MPCKPPSAAAHPRPRHTCCTHRRWQRAHTLAIVVIEAVFQAPMSALNADAYLKACEPSHTLSKSPHRMSPELRQSVQCMVHAASSGPKARGAMCCSSMLEIRPNCGGAVYVLQNMWVSILPENSEARKQACMPAGCIGRGREIWAQQRSIRSRGMETAGR